MWKRIQLDRFLVIDLETTCWDERDFASKEEHKKYQDNNREIIEVGVTEVSFVEKRIISKWTYYIKPRHSKINEYCTNLTGITDEKIKKEGVSLEFCSKDLRIKHGSLNKYFTSWGEFDMSRMRMECESKGVIFPFPDNFQNISDLFAQKHGLKKGIGLIKALEMSDLKFDGTQHSAMWDAYNTAKLFLKIMG